MNIWLTILMVFAMASVTYIIRAIPMIFIKKKITSQFLCSVLYYIPYAVLSAMTFPAIFSATQSIYSAIAGTAVGLILSLCKRSLITVAIFTCLATLIVELILLI